jgi:pimeloyl-ACP methyl ester carboxylesterase
MEMARDVALNIPDSKLEVIKGVGHTLNLEAPKITAELILDFLEHDN